MINNRCSAGKSENRIAHAKCASSRKTSGKLHVVRAAEVLYSSTHHESCITGRHAASGQRVEQAFEKMLYRAGHGIKHLMTTILMDFYC